MCSFVNSGNFLSMNFSFAQLSCSPGWTGSHSSTPRILGRERGALELMHFLVPWRLFPLAQSCNGRCVTWERLVFPVACTMHVLGTYWKPYGASRPFLTPLSPLRSKFIVIRPILDKHRAAMIWTDPCFNLLCMLISGRAGSSWSLAHSGRSLKTKQNKNLHVFFSVPRAANLNSA